MDAKFITPFHRFRLHDGLLTHNGETNPVSGAHAEVASSGLLMTRRSYLIITGPGYSYTARIDSVTMGRARAFAAAVNAAAQPPAPGS